MFTLTELSLSDFDVRPERWFFGRILFREDYCIETIVRFRVKKYFTRLMCVCAFLLHSSGTETVCVNDGNVNIDIEWLEEIEEGFTCFQ